jgi:hypothetical protein
MTSRLVNRDLANELWVAHFKAAGTGWIPVLTFSMVPLLRPDDLVYVSTIGAGPISFGEIVLFKRRKDLIVHRVFRKRRVADRVCFQERGDAGFSYGLIDADAVVGRVTRVKRGDRVYHLDSFPARIVNSGFTVWLFLAMAGVNRIRSQKSQPVKIARKVMYRLTRIITGLFGFICLVVWYLSALPKQGRAPRE